MRKLFLILMLIVYSITSLSASEINDDFLNYQTLKQFNGSVVVSQKEENGYNILYESTMTSDDGQNLDSNSIYNIGSITKLFTTVSILQLQENDKLNLEDPISMYIDGLSEDKKNITIEQLLTHTSGICIDYNMEATSEDVISKEDELARINMYDLCYTPGDWYIYNNSGFTLAAMIIENVSNMTYEEYIHKNIMQPLEMDNSGFPGDDLDSTKTINGYIDYGLTGNVSEEVYDWRNRGFTSVLTTPNDLTKFAYGIINNRILTKESVELMTTPSSVNNERAIGSNLLNVNGSTIIGHNGVWDYGNSVLYYRPSDNILLVGLSDEVALSYFYPAEDLRDDFFSYYPDHYLDNMEVLYNVNYEDNNKTTQENSKSENTNVNVVDPNTNENKQFLTTKTKLQISIFIVVLALIGRIFVKRKKK